MSDPVSGGGWSGGDVPPAAAPEGPRYERRQRLGRGGMGVVTVVWDRLLEREVALKEAIGPDGSLLHEARLTALLDHPNIVPIYDATTEPDGRVTYTMRLLRGRPLDQVAAGTPVERLRWLRALLAACEAVAHAHVSGVVHRDLKPANIVVGDLGETQVVDWGLARLVGDATAGRAGTAGYISPEQARGEPPAPSDDVWALGCAIAKVLGPQKFPELRAIVARATSPLPERYPDARALAADLAGFIDGRPVAAYRYSPFEVLTRLIRRHSITFSVAGIVAGIVAGMGFAGVAWQWRETGVERDRAVAAEADARRELATSLGGRAAQALRAGMLPEAEVLAIHALRGGRSPEAMGVLAALAAGARPTPVETVALPPGCDGPQLAGDTVLCSGADGVSAWARGATESRWRATGLPTTMVASSDRVLIVDSEYKARLLSLADGTEKVAATYPHGRRYRAFDDRIVVFGQGGAWTWKDDQVTTSPSPCPEGEILQDLVPGVAACDGGSLVVGDTIQRTPFTRAPAIPASLVVDGTTAWVGTFGGEVFAWDLGAERVVWSTDVGVGAVLTLRRLGDRVLAVGSRGARLLDPVTGSPIAALPAGARPAEPRGPALWTVGDTLVRWNVPAEAPLREAVAGVGLAGGAISPDGARIALSGGDGHLSIWSVATGRRLGVVQDGVEPLKPPIFLGSVALAGGATSSPVGVRRVAADGEVLPPIPPLGGVKRLAPQSDGTFLAINYGTGGPRRYDARGIALPSPAHFGPLMVDLAASPDLGAALALDQAGGLWSIGPDRLESAGIAAGAHAVALGQATRAWASEDAIQVGSREIRHPWSIPLDLALTPDARRVVTGSLDGTARVLDVATGELLAVLTGHGERVSGVDVSPDGSWVLTTSWDHRARRWDLRVLDDPLPPLPGMTLEAALQATAR